MNRVSLNFVKFKKDCRTRLEQLEELQRTSQDAGAMRLKRFEDSLRTLRKILKDLDTKLLCGNMRIKFELKTPKAPRGGRGRKSAQRPVLIATDLTAKKKRPR